MSPLCTTTWFPLQVNGRLGAVGGQVVRRVRGILFNHQFRVDGHNCRLVANHTLVDAPVRLLDPLDGYVAVLHGDSVQRQRPTVLLQMSEKEEGVEEWELVSVTWREVDPVLTLDH